MAINWYNMNYGGVNIVSVGIDWNITAETDTSLSIAPIIYRWDKLETDNYGSTWSESLSPDPVGKGSWSDISWGGKAVGTRQIDSFETRTYTKTNSVQTVTYKMSWDSAFGSWYNGAFRYLGAGSYTWTLSIPAKPAPNSYTIQYNANGGTAAPPPSIKTAGTTLWLTYLAPVRANYNFLGWSTSSSATSPTYLPSSMYTADANATLYAVWQEQKRPELNIKDTVLTSEDIFDNIYIKVPSATTQLADMYFRT